MIRPSRLIGGLAVALISAVLGYEILPSAFASEEAVVIPAPAVDNQKAAGPLQTAVVAGGCFWGVHGVYQHVRGTRQVLSGYSGGTKTTADYETVSRGDSGHTESVEIRFDPKELSYGEILQIYFSVVAVSLKKKRQGPDVGTQYRSAIFTETAEQAKVARAYVAQLNQARVFDAAIVTKISQFNGFYPAEDYHQN